MKKASDATTSKLIFLHIPKTGGTTFNSIIDSQYQPQEIFKINGSNIEESVCKFNQLSEQERAEIKIFRGHVHFGWHRYIRAPATYVTFLRSPVSRVISNYRHICRTPAHYLYGEVKDMSLQDYVRSKINPYLYGGQVRFISGLESEPLSEEMLEIAKSNLKTHFSVVGLTEEFDQALTLAANLYKWRFPFYTRKNVAHRSSKDISEDTIELIRETNSLDFKLYQFAQDLFEERTNAFGNRQFQASLSRFQHFNQIYGTIYYVYSIGKRMIIKA